MPGVPGAPTEGLSVVSVSRVSIIVVNWNGWHYLEGCLASLAVQEYADSQVILVDNASHDGSVERVREQFPTVQIIRNRKNLGFALANIQALPRCTGEYICLLNNDTAADPDWLRLLVAAMDESPNAAAVGGTLVALEDRSFISFTTPKIDPTSGRAIWVNHPSGRRSVDWLVGCSMLMRRSAIEQIGFLDPTYTAYYDETDWCARAIRAGYDLVYVPEAIVAHKQSGTTSAEFHDYMMERNHLRFVLKNFDLDALPRFARQYVSEVWRDVAQNWRTGKHARNRLLLRALAWNLLHLSETIVARRHDLARMRRPNHSYNRSLPLRAYASDGLGGLVPPCTAP